MSDRPSEILLEDILEACEKIFLYTKNLEFSDFKQHDMVRDAVERNLEIIGEAVNKLSMEIKISQPQIQWHKIIGLRNRLIHGYFSVDIPMLWNTVRIILPPFHRDIIKIVLANKP